MKTKFIGLLLGILLTVTTAFAQETAPTQTDLDIPQLAKSVAGDSKSGEEKTRRLVTWINTNFKWSATDNVKRTPEEIIARRAGNCFELANVLEVLLKAAGIRSRWVAEINIHPKSERRQKDAVALIAERGNRSSVFGYMHNDHRWLEVYDEKTKSWIPADPSVGVVGTKEWIRARVAFQDRTISVIPAIAQTVKSMIVPVVVVALESKRGKPIENRTEFYLIDGFDKFYGKRLKKLPSWNEWKKLDAQLAPLASAAFTGDVNLHEHGKLIEQIAQAYENLKLEAAQMKISLKLSK